MSQNILWSTAKVNEACACPPTRHMTKVRLSIDSPHRVVILRITPEYQYPWFCFYCPFLFPGGNLRAHIHNAFGNGGRVDYSPPNECKDNNKDNEVEEDEEGGGGGGGCPRNQK
jgi:hypothetical protein